LVVIVFVAMIASMSSGGMYGRANGVTFDCREAPT
jgi:hypothetical protein